MVAHGVLAGDDLALNYVGETKLRHIGTGIDELRTRRRPLTRPCLDWTERTHHLGGAIGASLLTHMLEQRRLTRHHSERSLLRITRTGRQMLAAHIEVKTAPA